MDEKYEIFDFLGAGTQGNVYVVKSAEGLFSAKEALDRDIYERLLAQFEKENSWGPGHRTVTVIAQKEPFILLEHVDGLPWDYVRINWQLMGWEKDEFAKLDSRFKQSTGKADSNVVYDFKNDEFVVVDLH